MRLKDSLVFQSERSFFMNFKSYFIFIFFSLLSFSVFAKADLTKIRIALDWVPEPEFGGFYAASLSGAYKKQNLDVELVSGGAGAPVVQMVSAGKFDFGTVSASEVVIARARGADVVALFAVYQTSPNCIMTHAKRGFKNLEEVLHSDGIVAMSQGQAYASFLEKKYGFKKAKIVPFTGGISEFLHNERYSQQGFIFSEPILAKRQGADPKTFLVAESGYNPYTTVLVTRAETIRKNPDQVKRLITAVREGWQGYLKDPEQANKFMATKNKAMDLETFREGARAQAPLIETEETKKNGLGTMTEARWKTLAEQVKDLKLISEVLPAKAYFH